MKGNRHLPHLRSRPTFQPTWLRLWKGFVKRGWRTAGRDVKGIGAPHEVPPPTFRDVARILSLGGFSPWRARSASL